MTRWAVCLVGGLLAVPLSDTATLEERRQYVAQLSEAEKADLGRRWREFSTLSAEERQRLRRLHTEIENDPERARLRATLGSYSRWLESLPPFRRAELMELPPDERVKRVKAILEDQARWEAKRPPGQDLAAFTRWLEQYVARHEAEVIKSMPEMHRRRLEEANPALRKRLLMWWRWQAVSAGILQPPSPADFAELQRLLSAETRAKLEAKPVAEQARIVSGWLKHTPIASALKGGPRAIDEQQLSYFFEHDLTEEQRDRLLGMPSEQMQRELLRMYLGPHGKGGDSAERRSERGGKRAMTEGLAPWRKPLSDWSLEARPEKEVPDPRSKSRRQPIPPSPPAKPPALHP
jgi:hypothetical protein